MRKLTAATVSAIALTTIVSTALAGPPIQLPALTRIASKLSGLPAKQKVRVHVVSAAAIERTAAQLLARDYPADQQAYDEDVYRALGLLKESESLQPALAARHVRGVRGLYDPVQRRLYVRSGAGVQTALVHELVHALQDQTFDLRRLSSMRRGSRDAGLAAAAAVEGHATFATTVLGGRMLAVRERGRTTQSHGASRIKQFLDLQSQFPYTTGLRFVTTLYNLGGRPAANGSLRRFPETTEQIFHIDAFLTREQATPILLPEAAAAHTLVRHDSFGELDVRALLAIFQVPRLDHAADGWGGGRSAVYRDAGGARSVAIVLEWDTEADALEWADAVATYVNEAFHADVAGPPPAAACARATCWNLAPRQVALSRGGARTALVFGTSAAAASALAGDLVVPR